MQVFELTHADGSKSVVTGQEDEISWRIVLTQNLDDVTKIELVNKDRTKSAIRHVNDLFHRYGKFYHSLSDIEEFVITTLTSNDFSANDLAGRFNGAVGEIRCHEIGRNVYLCVTWYQLVTGRYEFVGYIS